jgi:hypothetical protein
MSEGDELPGERIKNQERFSDEFWTLPGIADPAEATLRVMVMSIGAGCVRLLQGIEDRPVSVGMVEGLMRDAAIPILKAWSRLEEHKTGPYRDYLASDQWKSLRLSVICRDRCRCVRCGSCERLEVHHKTYARRGFEEMDDLETLCRSCHERHHDRARAGLESIL